jgi:hypothetical protein
MNHFDEFHIFLGAQKWMSESLYRDLSLRFSSAMQDAFERGKAEGQKGDVIILPTTSQLTKKQINELTVLAKNSSTFIDCIKRIRELTGENLLEAKNFAEKLRDGTNIYPIAKAISLSSRKKR